jgi:hypothetical protein
MAPTQFRGVPRLGAESRHNGGTWMPGSGDLWLSTEVDREEDGSRPKPLAAANRCVTTIQ